MPPKNEMITTINSEAGFEDLLITTFAETAGIADLEENRVDSFDSRGLMTRDHGVVVRLANGAEFQLTIKQSERARELPTDAEPCPNCDEGAAYYDGRYCSSCGYENDDVRRSDR